MCGLGSGPWLCEGVNGEGGKDLLDDIDTALPRPLGLRISSSSSVKDCTLEFWDS